MADLAQVSIQGIPVGSFLAMLVAFWALGTFLTRGTTQREANAPPRSQVAPLTGRQ
jgi:hypothetical protein